MIDSRWQLGHAITLSLAGGISWWSHSTVILAIFGLASFTIFITIHYRAVTHLRPLGGYANWVTASRCLALIVALLMLRTSEPGLSLKITLVLVLILDGMDGFLARKLNTTSEFGGHFDMETDAFFVMSLSTFLAIVIPNLAWIMIVGMWRYIYVIWLTITRTTPRTEPTSYLKKTITVFTIASLLLALFFWNEWVTGLLAASTILTSLSFFHSIRFQISGNWISIP